MPHAGPFELGMGADITWYAVPDALHSDREVCTPAGCETVPGYGSHPISAHVFLRLRPLSSASRMWNMRMAGPMTGHH